MSESTTNKPPVWYWVIAVIALIWNLMGVSAYLIRAYATDEMIAALPPEQQAEYLIEFPAYYTAAFAIAVFAGVLGCIALLIRKKWAYILFVLSALGAIVQHIYLFLNVEIPSYVMPILVIGVCLFLVWFARNSNAKGWLK